MLDQIPDELRQLPQWIIWNDEPLGSGRRTKLPYNCHNATLASSTNPEHWTTYLHSVAALNASGYSGLGLMLAQDGGYTFIDLDDPNAVDQVTGLPKHRDPEAVAAFQLEVFNRFKSYAEVSPSGKGLHIICRGTVPGGKGIRRAGVEMYSQERFLTMTGNVYRQAPIVLEQDAIDWLFSELTGKAPDQAGAVDQAYIGTEVDPGTDVDFDVLDRAWKASNGERFRALWEGRIEELGFTDRSAADYALMDILGFYTDSRPQLARLFRQSELGKRDKAQREDYVGAMITKSQDRKPKPIDLEEVRGALVAFKAGKVPAAPYSSDPVNPYHAQLPGLVHDLAYWIYQNSPRPVQEIALAASLALMAGICGRAWNTNTGMGLNLYILLLAGTGRGKETITTNIVQLMNAVTAHDGAGLVGAKEFLGPENIASGQALAKHLDRAGRSFVLLQSEFDLTLKNMVARNANAGLIRLKQIYLQAYMKSGKNMVLGSTIYSDAEKNTKDAISPAITIMAEGTPGRLYEALDEGLIADGLLPRFTVISYEGDRVARNVNTTSKPPKALVNRLAAICSESLKLNANNAVIDVGMTPEAQSLLDDFDKACDTLINNSGHGAIEDLWNRAHLKALKIASLLAVGVNSTVPTISAEQAKWAIDVVRHDTGKLADRFIAGDVGEGANKQIADLKRKFLAFIGSYSEAQSFGMTVAQWEAGAVPIRWLSQRVYNLASFKNDRRGAAGALTAVLKDMTMAGYIKEMGPGEKIPLQLGSAQFWLVIDAAGMRGD